MQSRGTRPGKCDVCEGGRGTRVAVKVLGLGLAFLWALERSDPVQRRNKAPRETDLL